MIRFRLLLSWLESRILPRREHFFMQIQTSLPFRSRTASLFSPLDSWQSCADHPFPRRGDLGITSRPPPPRITGLLRCSVGLLK